MVREGFTVQEALEPRPEQDLMMSPETPKTDRIIPGVQLRTVRLVEAKHPGKACLRAGI